jgi:23S rRNA (adenine-N6)-dimethyltransferase
VGAGDSQSRQGSRRDTARSRRKTHGQNFIRSGKLARSFVEAARIAPDEHVIEVGAGAGIITEELARRASRVHALELDPDWAGHLRRRFSATPQVTITHGDALRFSWPSEPFRVVGNVPFGITTKLLHALLDNLRLRLVRADLIVQHEVARKRAAPGPSTVLGLSWEPWFAFRILGRIPASAFDPRPAVDAAHLAIERRAEPQLDPRERRDFERFLRAGFSRGGILRPGLRTQLTNNQVRALRATVPFDAGTLCNQLESRDWVALYAAAKPYLPPPAQRPGPARARRSGR